MKNMKLTMTLAALMTGCALMAAEGQPQGCPAPDGKECPMAAQRGPEGGVPGKDMRRPMRPPMNHGNWMGKFICRTNTLDRLGVTNAVARAKLVKDLSEIDTEITAVEAKIDAVSKTQAKLAPEILQKPGADTKPMMEAIDEIGKLRTEQAKLATRVLITLRDQLTPEQGETVRKLMFEEGHRRFQARKAFNDQMDRREPEFRGRGGEGPAMGRGREGEGRGPEMDRQGPDRDGPKCGCPMKEGRACGCGKEGCTCGGADKDGCKCGCGKEGCACGAGKDGGKCAARPGPAPKDEGDKDDDQMPPPPPEA